MRSSNRASPTMKWALLSCCYLLLLLWCKKNLAAGMLAGRYRREWERENAQHTATSTKSEERNKINVALWLVWILFAQRLRLHCCCCKPFFHCVVCIYLMAHDTLLWKWCKNTVQCSEALTENCEKEKWDELRESDREKHRIFIRNFSFSYTRMVCSPAAVIHVFCTDWEFGSLYHRHHHHHPSLWAVCASHTTYTHIFSFLISPFSADCRRRRCRME